MVKKNLGRKKVEMVKMTNESHLLATFSKRRAGLFKKASELCTLCAVHVVIVVFSPGKKVYSFGHPSVDAVIDRFRDRVRPYTSGVSQIIEAHRNANMTELNMYLDQMMSQLDDGKKRVNELRKMNKVKQEQNWWMRPIEELDRPQLLQIRSAIGKLKDGMEAEITSILAATPHQFYIGCSSGQGMISVVDGGYTVPNLMAPPQGYNHNPEEEYMVGPDPIEEYIVDPAKEYIVNPADGENITPQGNNIFDAPGFTGTYNIDPQEDDILDVTGFEGFNTNPRGNDDLDSVEKVLKDFQDGFF